MMQRDGKKPLISEFIMQTVKNERPVTVRQLAVRVQKEYGLSEKEAVKEIEALQSYGSLRLEQGPYNQPATLTGYLQSGRSLWYWLTISLAAATTLAVFTIPESLYPLVYARYALGSIFVLLLPGYSFIKALFPKKELDNIERTALSVGMSLALVPIAGLLLNYTPWGIRVTPVTLSLLALTVAFATAALLREHATTRAAEDE